MALIENQAGAFVCAVVVAYHPDRMGLESLIRAIRSQVSQVVVIDNGFGEAPDTRSCLAGGDVAYMALPENIGLASAQNLGIQWAKAKGFTHILFLDQDGIPQKNMVRNMLNALIHLEKNGKRPAAVGPITVDLRTWNESSAVNLNPFSIKRESCRSRRKPPYVRTDFLMSSGMLAHLSVLAEVGMMDDRLFIDSVDLEWCYRAQHKGFSLYSICNAKLYHRMGDQVIPIGRGKRFNIYRHGPLRQYYMMRNRVLLYRRYYIPMYWRIQDFFRMIIKILFLIIFSPDRTDHLRMIFNGLWDAMHLKTGKYRP